MGPQPWALGSLDLKCLQSVVIVIVVIAIVILIVMVIVKGMVIVIAIVTVMMIVILILIRILIVIAIVIVIVIATVMTIVWHTRRGEVFVGTPIQGPEPHERACCKVLRHFILLRGPGFHAVSVPHTRSIHVATARPWCNRAL